MLGWTLADAVPPQAPGHHLIATKDGRDVAAIASGAAAIGQDPAWSTYFAVDDADAAAEAVAAAGGTVVVPPVDTPGGRAVACQDPQGAPFRLRQAGRRLGAQVTNEPGTWNFSDLHTDAPATASRFYAEFLPLRVGGDGFVRVPGYGDHLAATTDTGIRERQAKAPEGFADVIGSIVRAGSGEAPHWHVVFTVADRDRALEAVRAAGGEVESTSEDEWTHRAVVRDPAGARCTLSAFTPSDW